MTVTGTSTRRGRFGLGVCALLALLLAAGSTRAAEIAVEVSSRRVDVGIPFELQIEIKASEHETPVLPEMMLIDVIGGPSRSTRSFTSIVGGRTTRSDTVSYTYALVAKEPGQLSIPALTVVADGERYVSTPIGILAEKPDAGDMLAVEVFAAKRSPYLGEPVDLTLRIWIKPYRDEQLAGPLSGETMWKLIDASRSNWGDFYDAVRERSARRGRWPVLRGRTVLRPDRDGIEVPYVEFELQTTVWPQQAGDLELQPVAIMMEYPTRLERVRSFFSGSELQIAESRTLVASAAMPVVEVRSPPQEGRPDFFAGAVGRFDIDVGAKPTEVAVGDPITLRVTIVDKSPRGTPLDLLAPPPLAELQTVSRDFRVSSDPLAGLVDGRTKTFTQTIRARDEDVGAIPSIPFAFFDPEAEEYVVVGSNPIALTVVPTVTLAMGDVVGGETPVGIADTELTRVAGGLLANASGSARLLTDDRVRFGWVHAAAVLVPPMLFAFVAVGQRRSRRLRDDHGYARRRVARRTAVRRLQSARRAAGSDQAEEVASAVACYVADRLGAAEGSLTRAEVVARLRDGGAADDLVRDVESLLVECEQSRFSGDGAEDEDARADRAMKYIDRLERTRIR
jgi:hypothetical protein